MFPLQFFHKIKVIFQNGGRKSLRPREDKTYVMNLRHRVVSCPQWLFCFSLWWLVKKYSVPSSVQSWCSNFRGQWSGHETLYIMSTNHWHCQKSVLMTLLLIPSYGKAVSVHLLLCLRLYVDDWTIYLLWSSVCLAGTYTKRNNILI